MPGKRIRIAYLFALAIGMFFFLTHYSFSLDLFDYLLAGIIFIYPTVKFFQQRIELWFKISIGVFVIIAFVYVGQLLVFVAAFGEHKKYSMQSWKIGKYKIDLEKWQGWTGPPYDRYSLKRHAVIGVLEKKLGEGYKDSTACMVNFQHEEFGMNDYRFDTCNKTITKLK